MTTCKHPGETRTGDRAPKINDAAFAAAYALAKKLPTIQYIQTSYGPIDLTYDAEMRDAVFDAIEAILEFRLELAKEGK